MTNAGLTALGDPTRQAIFERLSKAPRAVGELAGEFPISRPAVSQHLRVLKEAGLVIDRHEGNRRIYQLDPAGVEALRGYFDQFWTDAWPRSSKRPNNPKRRSPDDRAAGRPDHPEDDWGVSRSTPGWRNRAGTSP